MGTLVMMHFPTNTGFALGALETLFYRSAIRLESGDAGRVHFSFQSLDGGPPGSLPEEFANLLVYDFGDPTDEGLRRLTDYVRDHGIRRVLAFDLTPGDPAHRALRRGGADRVVSYLGAPLGAVRSGPSLWLRRLRTALQPRADLYVFESEAMRETGTLGRGIRADDTTVIRTGLDLARFRPGVADPDAVKERLGVPVDRAVIFYSGHFEARKGVAVIVDAAIQLVDEEGFRGAHFVLCGNRPGEADPFVERLAGTGARDFVTFAGYRDDIPEIMSAADVGVIASTGWDSFPRTAMEISASGLPLVASALQGLVEAVEDGKTGFLFPPGDHRALAHHVRRLLDEPDLRARLGRSSRALAEERYAEERQVSELADALRG